MKRRRLRYMMSLCTVHACVCSCFRQKCWARASECRRSKVMRQRDEKAVQLLNCSARSGERLGAPPCQRHCERRLQQLPRCQRLELGKEADERTHLYLMTYRSDERTDGQPASRRSGLAAGGACRAGVPAVETRDEHACTRKVVGRSAP